MQFRDTMCVLAGIDHVIDHSSMEDKIDYRKFYDDEQYLLEVGQAFRKGEPLDAVDFYMMLVWKANRAKTYHRERLKRISGKSFKDAVSMIASGLRDRSEAADRLELLMCDWGFALPTATAVLTLLYPEQFTVYDVLVCGEIGWRPRPYLSFSPKLWSYYLAYKQAVIEETPADLSLRNKDRFLIGRAYRKDVELQSRE